MRKLVVLLPLFVAAQVLVGASPASAIVGLQRVAVTSSATSSAKTITVDCPNGTVATGGGGYLVAGAPKGEIGFDTMRPLANGNYEVHADEADVNFGGSWKATAVALCAPEPAGFEIDEAVSGGGSSATRSVDVPCPSANGRVIGAGGRISGGSGHVFLTGIVPSADLTSVTVSATETTTGTGANWTVTGTVVCADEPAGHVRQSDSTMSSSDDYDSMLRICPDGKQMYGTGFSIDNGGGQVLLYGLNVTPVTTIRLAAAEDANGYAGSWSMTEYAICAT